MPAAALREAQLKSIAALQEQTKATLGEPLAPVRLWAPFIVQQTAETGTERTAEDVPTSLDAQATAPIIGGGEERGKGGTQRVPPTGQTPRGQESVPQESPQLDTVSIEVHQPAGLAAYRWWNLIVPLLAVVGLVVLSRVHLNAVPAEETGATTTPVVRAAQPSVPYARLVRRSSIDVVPPEIAFVHDEILIGSGAECDEILRHPSIARQHARVQWRNQGYVLCDLQSPTGTYVNGRRIKENLLKDGWTVRLGEVEFVFHGTKPQP